MGLLDEFFPELATEVIELLGTTLTLFRSVKNYDPLTATSIPTESTYPGLLCSPPIDFEHKLQNGTIVTAQKWILPGQQFVALGITPDPTTDSVTFGGQTRQIFEVEPIMTGELVAAYWLKVLK